MDNHADTIHVSDPNFTAVQFTGEHCKVSPFSEQYNRMRNIPVASAAMALDNPETGETTL
jgi:hypothetical protein